MKNALAAAAAVLAVGVASPAFAQGGANSGSGGDTNIENFERQSPHAPPTNNGIPQIIDNRDGSPVIRYRGPQGPGMQEGGIPRIVDNRGGDPVISYGGQPVPGDTNDSSGMQTGVTGARNPGMQGGAMNQRGMQGGAMQNGAMQNGAMQSSMGFSAQVQPLLSRARTALQRGQYSTAASTLERAETEMLNSGVQGTDQTLRMVSEARSAAYKRDRSSALQALNSAMQQTGG
ncbi:hypothetical protein IAI58_06645 [Roseomonas marmotae]|uniref:DUF4168 domain-containing protein n=2 Tax=Roseomonas marmotae TaxID=2768161 RepID=A0ABS3KAK1_9PROT|nr:hypothetical protein [Roseomonas marmotae]MBO1073386.1 hypothetical protein [Roseomonas marmotae]QTI80415.1 hypothetical protein IAI58_06645 [Roseomonas marmotae]